MEAPLVLTHVCRYWRNLALSTPSLWSSIFIYLPNTYQLEHTSSQGDTREALAYA